MKSRLIDPSKDFMLALFQYVVSRWNPRGLPHLAWWMRYIVLGNGLQPVMFQNRFRFFCDCDVRYSVLQAYGFIHLAMDRVLRCLIHEIPGDVWFFDIGANIGFVSMLASSISPDRVHAVCFEPNSDAFQKLQNNLELNSFKTILENTALGAEIGTTELQLGAESSNSSVVASGIPGVQVVGTESVLVNTLDDYCFKTGILPSIMKVDVEGFEPYVLQGGMSVIKSVKPYLIIEINPRTLLAGGNSSLCLIEMIKRMGYKLFYIDYFQVGLHTRQISHRRQWKGFYGVEESDDHENHLFDILAVPESYF